MAKLNGKLVGIIGVWVLMAGFGTAEAVPISVSQTCPDTGAPTREFTVEATEEIAPVNADVTCGPAGSGNLNDDEFGTDWIFIDKDEADGDLGGMVISGMGGTSGTFSIAESLWGIYGELLIGFKVGAAAGQEIDPDWATFILTGGVLEGNWSITGSQGLSHATLWGRGTPREPAAVPEPATLLLLGSGLLVAARRRRAKR